MTLKEQNDRPLTRTDKIVLTLVMVVMFTAMYFLA